MDVYEYCDRIANSLYNEGLDRANRRDLTGAAGFLKKALKFNKNHKSARNLLGLIYFETGEVSDALVQWVISYNIYPENNIADKYIEEIQRKQGILDSYGKVIEDYNGALEHAQTGSEDLAILELSHALESNPRYIRAHLLLALLYMARKQYDKARRSLLRVLQIDKNNPRALWYMSELKQLTGRADIENKKIKNLISHSRMEEDDVILPPSYKENTGWQTMFNICIGLVIGAVTIGFLYMPAKIRKLTSEHNKALLEVEDKLDSANVQIGSMQKELDSITSENDSLTQQWNTQDEASNYKLSQYQLLIGILDAYRKNNLSLAADLYASLDAAQLTDIDDGSSVSVTGIYNEIASQITADGYITLSNLGDAAYEAGNYESAINYYDKSLKIKPDYVRAMYSKALTYKKLGDIQTANSLFGDIIMNYSNSEYAGKAKLERGY